jgi:hypothetical protein
LTNVYLFQVGLGAVVDIGLDGLLGLSFDGEFPSPLTAALKANGRDPILGEPFLFNIFDQPPEQDNFIGISLSRTDDLESSADGSLTLNEIDERYAAVKYAPLIPLFPSDNGVWSMLLDGISVDGVDIPLPPSTLNDTPAGKAVMILDTGTPTNLLPQQLRDAIYSQIPGTVFELIEDFGVELWVIPCNTTTIVSVYIGYIVTLKYSSSLIIVPGDRHSRSTRWICQMLSSTILPTALNVYLCGLPRKGTDSST